VYKIIHKAILAQGIKRIDIAAPIVAAKALPGQFVMITPGPSHHNLPMTIVEADERRGSISLIVHEVGPGTKALGALSIGDQVEKLVGPLGVPAKIDKYGLVVCVATGIGAAQILPICRALKKKGNKIIGIVGAKSKKVLMLESQMRVVCDEIFITTNDGSYERKGLATEVLRELLEKYPVNCVYAIGSGEMMQAAEAMTRQKNIPLRVTLSPYMANGLGVCGSCRIKVDGKIKLACVEGPEFNGHEIDYNYLNRRMNAFEGIEWASNQTLPRKTPGLTTFVKSLWGLGKK
jgi:ferredoxin--NADP+ reductase